MEIALYLVFISTCGCEICMIVIEFLMYCILEESMEIP